MSWKIDFINQIKLDEFNEFTCVGKFANFKVFCKKHAAFYEIYKLYKYLDLPSDSLT